MRSSVIENKIKVNKGIFLFVKYKRERNIGEHKCKRIPAKYRVEVDEGFNAVVEEVELTSQ